MVWDQLSVNKPHLVYIILGGFTSIFMLVSLFIKEKLYIGEATVATVCGVIFGPHAANLIDPGTWGNVDQITLEFSRIVLVVQCFAVGVELPKAYMERHWRSVVFLLVPVMTFGWLITSLFIWWLIEPLSWLESLAVAACVTATDPVLASSVVGKGKFAKRVPKHLRDVLSAESGCNDGMAFPFIYLALYLLKYELDAAHVTYHWICFTVLYECIFGAIYGFVVGYIGRHAIKLAERKGIIDRESFLVFYFVLALFCAGSGSLLGMDDLLIGFAAGVGFSNDGWFTEKTEESHVSNVIDLLINLSYFVYFGTIIPWDQFNAPDYGLVPWRLVVIAILVILFRRIPAMLLLKPFIPDVKTWREAMFAGHFGPIGVGAIFVAILARAELETGSTTPLRELPPPDDAEYTLIYTIWPIVSFLVIASIIVHGSSVAVFTLGKRINTLTITLTYTQDNAKSSAWMDRLPRISSQSRSMSKMSDDSDVEKGIRGFALRRQREEDDEKAGSRSSSLRPRRRKRKNYGGPVSDSAILPSRMSEPVLAKEESGSDTLNEKSDETPPDMTSSGILGEPPPQERTESASGLTPSESRQTDRSRQSSPSPSTSNVEVEAYDEGDRMVIEDEEGNVLRTTPSRGRSPSQKADIIEETRRSLAADQSGLYTKHSHEAHAKDEGSEIEDQIEQDVEHPQRAFRDSFKNWAGFGRRKSRADGADGPGEGPGKEVPIERKRGPAHAYQFGNTIIVEDEDGEVIKKYTIPSGEGEPRMGNEQMRQRLQRMGTWVGLGRNQQAQAVAAQATGVSPDAMEEVQDGPDETANDRPQPDKRPTPARQVSKLFRRQEDDTANSDDDDGLRLTISRADRYGLTGLQRPKTGAIGPDAEIATSSGRRMSAKDFLKQMQSLDPKTKVREVEQSNAPAQLKQDIKEEVVRESGRRYSQGAVVRPGARRTETTPGQINPSVREQDDASLARPLPAIRGDTDRTGRSRPALPRLASDRSVNSVDSERDVPVHDTRAAIARHRLGLTAADQRRQQLSTMKETPDESEQDEGERETAAERRRRLAALGTSGPNDSDSDEEVDRNAPRQPRAAAVREPDDEGSPATSQVPRRIQWGGESGREPAVQDTSSRADTHGESSGMAKRFKKALHKNVG